MTLASLPGKKSSERGEGGLWMDPSSFSIEFQRGKENGVGGFVVDCEWIGGAGAERRRRSRPACTSEGASNTLSTGGFPDQLLVGGEKCCVTRSPMGSCESLCGRSGRGQLAVARPGTTSPVWQELQDVCLHGVGHVLFIAVQSGLAGPVSPPQGRP
jgi:hypothetical protein